jgi:hypothetical protein
MSNQVQVDAALHGAIRTEFVTAYKKSYDGLKSRMGNLMNFDLPTDKRQEIYAYFESAPYPRHWRRGQDASFDTFEAVNWTVYNRDWVSGVNWHEDDEQDDMTRSLVDRARDAGANFGIMDERIFFQILLGSTDADLLPSIPNAPDGVDLFNATDGASAARFGISGGNIVTGQTLNTAQGLRSAVFAAIVRMAGFKDTKSQPLWDPSMLDKGFTLILPLSLEQTAREAFLQSRTLQVHAGTSTTDTTAAAAVSNIILESGLKIEFFTTQRLTSASAVYLFAHGSQHKALFTLNRQGLRETPYGRENSDSGRMRKEKGIIWDSRRGYGVFLPYQCIQITT